MLATAASERGDHRHRTCGVSGALGTERGLIWSGVGLTGLTRLSTRKGVARLGGGVEGRRLLSAQEATATQRLRQGQDVRSQADASLLLGCIR